MDIEVSLETPVEDLVEKYPEAVGFLRLTYPFMWVIF